VLAILFDGLLLETLLGNVPLFMAVVTEMIVASASKKGALNWAFTLGSEWHAIFGCSCHGGVGDMGITQLFHCLYLLHPALYSIQLHVNCDQCLLELLFLPL